MSPVPFVEDHVAQLAFGQGQDRSRMSPFFTGQAELVTPQGTNKKDERKLRKRKSSLRTRKSSKTTNTRFALIKDEKMPSSTRRILKRLPWLIAGALLMLLINRYQTIQIHNANNTHAQAVKSCLEPDLWESEVAHCAFYTLVLDAGSTGTRIHVNQYAKESLRSESLILVKESYLEVKPGISYYVSSPALSAASIQPLLDLALRTIPQSLHSVTPIILRATAGVRLLAKSDAHAIMQEMRKAFHASPFVFTDDGASIMSGDDEGVFGWFSLNYLLKRLHFVQSPPKDFITSSPFNQTVVALDMGGGSTQVTVRPMRNPRSTLEGSMRVNVSVFGTQTELHTHSYLGNGIMASRLNIFRRVRGFSAPQMDVDTPCMPSAHSTNWTFNGETFFVRGTPDYSYEACADDADAHVALSNVYAPRDALLRKEIHLFGYYYDRAEEVGLIHGDMDVTTVAKMKAAAEKACTATKFGPAKHEPWLCFDLTYLHALLSKGFHIPDHKPLHFTKLIDGLELSWALGAGFDLLERQVQSSKLVLPLDD